MALKVVSGRDDNPSIGQIPNASLRGCRHRSILTTPTKLPVQEHDLGRARKLLTGERRHYVVGAVSLRSARQITNRVFASSVRKLLLSDGHKAHWHGRKTLSALVCPYTCR